MTQLVLLGEKTVYLHWKTINRKTTTVQLIFTISLYEIVCENLIGFYNEFLSTPFFFLSRCFRMLFVCHLFSLGSYNVTYCQFSMVLSVSRLIIYFSRSLCYVFRASMRRLPSTFCRNLSTN